jgi:hypothetical protein
MFSLLFTEKADFDKIHNKLLVHARALRDRPYNTSSNEGEGGHAADDVWWRGGGGLTPCWRHHDHFR